MSLTRDMFNGSETGSRLRDHTLDFWEVGFLCLSRGTCLTAVRKEAGESSCHVPLTGSAEVPTATVTGCRVTTHS